MIRAAAVLLALTLFPAPAATAAPFELTPYDVEFVDATSKIIMGWGDWAGPDGWVGYSSWPAPDRVATAHEVCALLDGGANSVNAYIAGRLEDTRRSAGYLAAHFENLAIEYYCPQHSDRIGQL